jgi:hypothetical protein
MIAFAVDLGYLAMVKTQLQVAADSAALASAGSSCVGYDNMRVIAKAYAGYHMAGSSAAVCNDSDVVFGTWDTTQAAGHEFAVTTGGLGTAVKVTTHATGIPLFFGRIFGTSSQNMQASAVAAVNPRDICFVVDLSSSMNNDTAPGSGTTTHDSMIQGVYDDLFGAGNVNYLNTRNNAAKTISGSTIAAKMNLLKSSTYFPYIVPTPDPNDSASVQYWTDVLSSTNLNNSVSYKNYVNLLMTRGRTQAMIEGTTRYSIMSTKNPAYKYHTEVINDVSYEGCPVREMPTHAVRRAVITAIQQIQTRNATVVDAAFKDHVSIVAFDRANDPTNGQTDNVVVLQALTDNYTNAMNIAIKLQACGDIYGNDQYGRPLSQNCTDSEGGLIKAYDHIKAESKGGAGRENANKVIVFLTDGQPNIKESLDSVVEAARKKHTEWGTDYSKDAAYMQAENLCGAGWTVYAVGVGAGGDQTFMDQMAKMAGTQIPKTDKYGKPTTGAYDIAKDSGTYEATLKDIFQRIITNPKLRIVQ